MVTATNRGWGKGDGFRRQVVETGGHGGDRDRGRRGRIVPRRPTRAVVAPRQPPPRAWREATERMNSRRTHHEDRRHRRQRTDRLEGRAPAPRGGPRRGGRVAPVGRRQPHPRKPRPGPRGRPGRRRRCEVGRAWWWE